MGMAAPIQIERVFKLMKPSTMPATMAVSRAEILADPIVEIGAVIPLFSGTTR
jgi:hypothetical protein